MPSSDDGEDVFFDSVDYIRTSDSVSCDDAVNVCSEFVFGKSEYEFWRNEPGSVQERRERFLQRIGFSEFSPLRMDCSQEIDKYASCGGSPEIQGLERITGCGEEAVSTSWVSFDNGGEEDPVCDKRYSDVETKFMVRELGEYGSSRLSSAHELQTSGGFSPSFQKLMQKDITSQGEENCGHMDMSGKKVRSWWKSFLKKRRGGGSMCKSDVSGAEAPKTKRMYVRPNRKGFMEFTGLYMGQEIQAHKGSIWTMKFSPDGRYLASGGEDGVVRIWRVTSMDASCKYFNAEGCAKFVNKVKDGKFIIERKNSSPASVVIPMKVFKIEESSVQEFHGHTSDVLDLSWSKSNFLLSSSKDKTVCLWQVGCGECLKVFYHKNYVTCIQFNPVNDGYFISGSIDGKLRIWGISEGRVVDWADARDIVTAICYRPDGQGCVVGSITGNCRFYDASGNHLQLDAQICITGKKKSFSNRITGIQFYREDSQRLMITSADSKVRIFHRVEVIRKYRGLRKSGSQMSASFTSNGRHIISVGEDSNVYVWNYDGMCAPSSKHLKSEHSCEHFFSEGVSVAIPWSGMEVEHMAIGFCSLQCSLQKLDHLEAASWFGDSERYSLGGWFSMDGSSRGSATWPEEKLPLWAVPVAEYNCYHHYPCPQHHHQWQQQQHYYHHHHYHNKTTALSATWGLIIVTATLDGVIRTFHNYGLPVRL